MREIKDLVGQKITEGGKLLEIINAYAEGGNIVLETKEISEEMKEVKKYEFSEQSLNLFDKVHPKLVEVMKTAISESPYDFKITAGARTAAQQNALYQIGRTRVGSKVTNADGYKTRSNHQIKADGYGHAVDIFICGKYDEQGNYIKYNTQEGYEFNKLKAVAEHIKGIAKQKGYNVQWGGDWKGSWDSPHFEIKV